MYKCKWLKSGHNSKFIIIISLRAESVHNVRRAAYRNLGIDVHVFG